MRVTFYVVLAIALALAGCRKTEPPTRQTSSDAPATAPASPQPPVESRSGPRSAPPSRELMQDHFTAVVHVRDALIVGNLELAKWNASFLAQREPDPAVASWSAYVDRLRENAAKVAETATLEAAALASTELVLECGRCHAANGVTPRFPATDERVAASGTRPHMLRHQWAVQQMWDGLIGPSEERWKAGVGELAEAPLGQDEVFSNATAAASIVKRAEDVHALGAEGGKVTSWPDRAAVYGRLLATCAGCHAAIPNTFLSH